MSTADDDMAVGGSYEPLDDYDFMWVFCPCVLLILLIVRNLFVGRESWISERTSLLYLIRRFESLGSCPMRIFWSVLTLRLSHGLIFKRGVLHSENRHSKDVRKNEKITLFTHSSVMKFYEEGWGNAILGQKIPLSKNAILGQKNAIMGLGMQSWVKKFVCHLKWMLNLVSLRKLNLGKIRFFQLNRLWHSDEFNKLGPWRWLRFHWKG